MVFMRPVYDANNEKTPRIFKFYKALYSILNNRRVFAGRVVYYFFLDFDKYFSNIIAVIAKSYKFSYHTESYHQLMDMLFIY